MIDIETVYLICIVVIVIVGLCILGKCYHSHGGGECTKFKSSNKSKVSSMAKIDRKRQGFRQLEMGALEIVSKDGKKSKRIRSNKQEYNSCGNVSDDSGSDENCDHVSFGTHDVCVPIVNTIAQQAVGEHSDPETMAIYDDNNSVHYNVEDWSQSDVLKWLKSHLINNHIESNATDMFIKEFETKYVTGKVLLQLKKDDTLFQHLKTEFSKTNQVFGIWVVFKTALESLNDKK